MSMGGSTAINVCVAAFFFFLRYGTLLSNACQSTQILGGNMDLLESAKNFGLEIAFAWQVSKVSIHVYDDGFGVQITIVF